MNLTEISIAVRKLTIIGIAGFVIFLILRFFLVLTIAYIKSRQPPLPPPPPNVRFNKLPKPKFTGMTSSSGLKFALLNIEGKPPETTDSAKVYAMPKKLPTLLSSERAKAFAKKLNFTNDPDSIASIYYHYTDPLEPLRTLDLDIVNMNFSLIYNFAANPAFVFNPNRTITKEGALVEVKNFIRTNTLFDETIMQGKNTTTLFTYLPQTKDFSKALSLSAADAIRLDYFRADLDSMKILPAKFDESFTYALYSPNKSVNSGILELSYTFWPIAYDDFATYPVKTGAEAWQDLIDGYGFVVRLGNNKPDQIIIRNIYLAYYDTKEPQLFLQPIFVFEGDNDFVAYIPAVTSDWLE